MELGERYGRLTVIANLGRRPSGAYIVQCRCDCGEVRVVQVGNLRHRNTTQCNLCANKARGKHHKSKWGYGVGEQARHYIFSNYQSRARQRGHQWELSFDYFCELTSADCVYCGSPPSNRTRDRNGDGVFVYNGIDRIDSLGGYVHGNVTTACVVCNRAKTNTTTDQFLAWLDRLVERRHLWPTRTITPSHLSESGVDV